VPIGGITMRDNEMNEQSERNSACWARSVQVRDYVIVNGSATNIGAFVVWNIKVETLTVRLRLWPFAKTTVQRAEEILRTSGQLHEH
jgi:hypothetical protein